MRFQGNVPRDKFYFLDINIWWLACWRVAQNGKYKMFYNTTETISTEAKEIGILLLLGNSSNLTEYNNMILKCWHNKATVLCTASHYSTLRWRFTKAFRCSNSKESHSRCSLFQIFNQEIKISLKKKEEVLFLRLRYPAMENFHPKLSSLRKQEVIMGNLLQIK